jgi:hypothetical protein
VLKKQQQQQQQQQQQCQAHPAGPPEGPTRPPAGDASGWFVLQPLGVADAPHSAAQPSPEAQAGHNPTAADAAGAATVAAGVAPGDVWLQLPGMPGAPHTAHAEAEPAACTDDLCDGLPPPQQQQQQVMELMSVTNSWAVLPAPPAGSFSNSTMAAVASEAPSPQHPAAALGAAAAPGSAEVRGADTRPAAPGPTICSRDCSPVATGEISNCSITARSGRGCGNDKPVHLKGLVMQGGTRRPLAAAGQQGAADRGVVAGDDDAGHAAVLPCHMMPSAAEANNDPGTAAVSQSGVESGTSRGGNTLEGYLR